MIFDPFCLGVQPAPLTAGKKFGASESISFVWDLWAYHPPNVKQAWKNALIKNFI